MASCVIYLETERRKRIDPTLLCIKLGCMLEDILEESPIQNYLAVLEDFIAGMDMGERPIQAFAQACKSNEEAFQIIEAVLSYIPETLYLPLLEIIVKLYPKERHTLERIRIVYTTLKKRSLSFKKMDCVFTSARECILNYILGNRSQFERYAFIPDVNVVQFSRYTKRTLTPIG